MKGLLVVVVLAGLAGGSWYGYRMFNGRPVGEEYVFAPIDRGDIVATVAATGTIQPTTKVVVGSQVSGTVVKLYSDFNAPVKTGELLVEIDPQRFKSQVMQQTAAVKTAEARVEEARVRLRDAQREASRIANLRKSNSASDNEYQVVKTTADAAEATLHANEALLEASKAELESAEVDLSRTRINCPIDGVVISRDIDVGQTVAASLQAPTLFTIAADLRKMQVEANVAESDVGRIREGMQASFRVDAYPDRRFSGTVSQVRYNPTVVDNIVTYVTIIDVENPELVLRPGMTANVTFEVARVANALRVPNAALRFSPELPRASSDTRGPDSIPGSSRGPKVYRLASGRPAEVTIDIGLTDGSFTEIRGGQVADGEQIILDRKWGGGGSPAGRPGGMRPPRAM